MHDAGLVALRYPRGEGVGVLPLRAVGPIGIGTGEVLREGAGKVAIVGYGTGVQKGRGRRLLAEGGIDVTVADARFSPSRARRRPARPPRRRANCAVDRGGGRALGRLRLGGLETLSDGGEHAPRILRVGLPDRYVTHGKPALLHAEVGFTGKAIAARIEAGDRRVVRRWRAPEPRRWRSLSPGRRARRRGRPAAHDIRRGSRRCARDYVETAIRLGGALEPVGAVEDVVIGRAGGDGSGGVGLAARAYVPKAPEPVGALVWLHGGWCIGDLDGFDRVCRSLCNAAIATVVSIDYRPRPSTRGRPRWRMRTWRSTGRPATAPPSSATTGARGDRGYSAGGNSPRSRRATGRPLRAAARLPGRRRGDGHRVVPSTASTLTAEAAEFCWRMVREADRAAPDVSPLKADDLRGCRRRTSRSPASTSCVTRGLEYAEALEASARSRCATTTTCRTGSSAGAGSPTAPAS